MLETGWMVRYDWMVIMFNGLVSPPPILKLCGHIDVKGEARCSDWAKILSCQLFVHQKHRFGIVMPSTNLPDATSSPNPPLKVSIWEELI